MFMFENQEKTLEIDGALLYMALPHSADYYKIPACTWQAGILQFYGNSQSSGAFFILKHEYAYVVFL